jgi:hypothetical protein
MTLHFTQIFFTDARTFIALVTLLCAQKTSAKSEKQPSAFSRQLSVFPCRRKPSAYPATVEAES